MLLIGDASLRRLAKNNDVEAHGLLWITEELETHEIVAADRLHEAICLFCDDELVFLPEEELLSRTERLARAL